MNLSMTQIVLTITLNLLPSYISVFGEFLAILSNKNIPQALSQCLTCVGDTGRVTSDGGGDRPISKQ